MWLTLMVCDLDLTEDITAPVHGPLGHCVCVHCTCQELSWTGGYPVLPGLRGGVSCVHLADIAEI